MPVGARTFCLVGLGLLGFGAVLGYQVGRRSPAVSATPGEQVAPTETATTGRAKEDQEKEVLRREVRRLSVALKRAQGALLQAPSDDPASEETDVAAPTPEEEAAWLLARADFYDQLLRGEPRNQAWAKPLEDRAETNSAAQKEAGVELVNARCYATACRMEFSYRDAQARVAHLQAMTADFPELARTYYAYPGELNGQVRAVLFMSTNEKPLPPFDYASHLAHSGPVESP